MAIIKVVGFDPAFANWGTAWATVNSNTKKILIHNLELITTKKDSKSQVRISSDRLARAKILSNHVKEACKGQQIIFSEIPTGTQSSVAAIGLGIAVGIIASANTPVIRVSPNETKTRTVGKSNASKAAMINWAYNKHPEVNWLYTNRKGKQVLVKSNEHLADAIAVIYAGVQSDQFLQLCALYESKEIKKPKLRL